MLLTKLPPELRLKVYAYLLEPEANRIKLEDGRDSYSYKEVLVVFKLNRQIYHESRKVFFDLNTFIRIQTPWPDTLKHVIQGQLVPVVAEGDRAKRFNACSLTVSIDAPAYQIVDEYPEQFIIHIADLSQFTRRWYYADIDSTFNPHLRISLELDAPQTPSYEARQISKAVQKRLLLPFGDIRRLHGTRVIGVLRPYSSIEKELLQLQAVAVNSPEECFREANQAKIEGNAEIQAGHYQAALEHYRRAWRAIHIIVEGTERHIYCDYFFGRPLYQEYTGKNGQHERLLIRLALVANTCLAYLKLSEHKQCIFWGMRSITMLRESTGTQDMPPQEEAVRNFSGGADLGHIYEHTAASLRALGRKEEARKLYLVAREYLAAEKSRLDSEIKQCL